MRIELIHLEEHNTEIKRNKKKRQKLIQNRQIL